MELIPLAYLRVSSRGQDAAMQRLAIERAAAARGDAIPEEEWRQEKKSAKTMDRPELQRLLAQARAGELRGRRLYLYRLDRLTRTGIVDTLGTIEDLQECGVALVTVADGFDMEGPHWDIIVAVMAWAAKMERLAINERIAAARDRVEAEGGHWGRRARLSRADVEKVVAMHKEGRSTRQIAIALKVPKSTIGDALSNKHARKWAARGASNEGSQQGVPEAHARRAEEEVTVHRDAKPESAVVLSKATIKKWAKDTAHPFVGLSLEARGSLPVDEPCEAAFEHLGERFPGELAVLIGSGKLTVEQLSYAAEALGRSEDAEGVRRDLTPLLEHPAAVVREGALYGLAAHLDAATFARVERMADEDENEWVRSAAADVLLEGVGEIEAGDVGEEVADA